MKVYVSICEIIGVHPDNNIFDAYSLVILPDLSFWELQFLSANMTIGLCEGQIFAFLQ